MTLVRGEEDFRLKRVSGRTGGSQMGNSSAKPDGRNGSGGGGGVGTGRDGTERERERIGCLNTTTVHAPTRTLRLQHLNTLPGTLVALIARPVVRRPCGNANVQSADGVARL